MVERLCAMADLPKPKVAVIDTDVPNAFATGRNPKHAAVAVTSGLWQRLEPREVEGVLAHELSHIANRDVLIMTVASFFAMLAGLLARYSVFFGGGGDRDRQRAADLARRARRLDRHVRRVSYVLIRTISRYREYAADRGAALITGAPENLMSALQKISSGIASIPQRDLREVQAMNAFFIIPTNVQVGVRRALRDAPAAREAARGARRDRARDGPRRSRWALTDVLFGRKKLKEAKGERLFALSTARVTLEVELGLKPAEARGGRLQAALVRRLRPRRERARTSCSTSRRATPARGSTRKDGRVRLRVDRRRGPRLRGSRRDRPPRRLRAQGARLRAAAARGGLPLRRRQASRLLRLRLQARRVLAVRPDGEGQGARQRRGARAEGEARAGAADRAGPHALARALRCSCLRLSRSTTSASGISDASTRSPKRSSPRSARSRSRRRRSRAR